MTSLRYFTRQTLSALPLGWRVWLMVLLLGTLPASVASAQNAQSASFEELPARVPIGERIVVVDSTGAVRRGRVREISRDHIELEAPVAAGTWEALLPLYPPLDLGLVLKRRLFKSDALVLEKGTIARVEIVDSTANGTAIGLAIGTGIATGVHLWERRRPESNLRGLWTALAVVCGIPVSTRIGHVLDRALNRAVFEQSPGTVRVEVKPSLAQGRGGVLVGLSWP